MNVDCWIAMLTLGIFILDLFGPSDLAVCLLYLVPLFWTYRSPRAKQPFVLAAACTVLILLDTVGSASRLAWPVAICNQGLITATLWGIAFLLVWRKRAEADLRHSEALSQELINSSIIGVVQLDLNGQIHEANDAFLQMLGYTREDLRAGTLSWDKLTPPECQHGNELPNQQLQAFGVYPPTERVCLHQDGARVSVLIGGSLLEPSRQRAVAVVLDISDRKAAELASRRNERNYRQIVETAEEGVWTVDRAWTTTFVNARLSRMLGYDAHEMLGRPLRDFVRTEERPLCELDLAQRMRGIAPTHEFRFQCRDGHDLWVLLAMSPLSDEANRPMGALVMVTDITQRVRSEQELRVRVRQQATVAELGQLALAGTELKVLMDAAAARVASTLEAEFGYVLELLPDGKTLRLQSGVGWEADRIGQPVMAAGDEAEGSSAWLSPYPIIVEDLATDPRVRACPLLREHGAVSGVSVTIHGEGRPYGVLGVFSLARRKFTQEDVHFLSSAADLLTLAVIRKRGELAERARLAAILESTSDFVVIVDRHQQPVYLNQAAREVLRIPAQGDLAHPVSDTEGRGGTSAILSPEGWEAAVRDGRWSGEVPWQTRDGGELPVSMVLLSLQAPNGSLEYVAAIARDVTERQRAQAELARAKEAAETANAAKSQFLANMSHELRTPMTAILGFSELLLTANLPVDGQRQCLELIRKSGDTLLRLINDILDLSRIEAGRLVLDLADVSLQQILDEVLSVVRGRAEEKRLKLELIRQGPLPDRIRTDPLRLRQILVNLVDNAVKFTEQGEVSISLQSHRHQDGSERLQFVIADTGIGIPPDKMAVIFQPFMQADASLTRRFGGTGLGLAISKRLAKSLHGDIAATSEYGRGSTFILTLHVAPPGKEGGSPVAPGRPAAGNAAPKLQGRVLLAEDVPGIQMFVREVLRTMNVELDIAEDGRRACELAEQSQVEGRAYELILMDIQMPVMNGHQATRWLRERGWQGPIYALTAHVMAGDREKCLEAGCDGHIAKPVSAIALQDVLIRYLRAVPR